MDATNFGWVVSALLGWIYTLAWSLSFYPQVIMNFRRRSVQGLSIDFLYMNVLGFFCYSIFNITQFASPEVRNEYRQRHSGHDPKVRGNDVAFSVHALILATICALQSLFYKRDAGQRVSSLNRVVLSIFLVFIVVASLFAGVKSQSRKWEWQWLDVVNWMSYMKLYISFAKYVPQVWMNFKRKSTVGWSIHNILLDFTGGILSILQLVLDCALSEDWSAITGDAAKFGLGFIAIAFDLVFMTQHYLLYRHSQSGLLKDHVIRTNSNNTGGLPPPVTWPEGSRSPQRASGSGNPEEEEREDAGEVRGTETERLLDVHEEPSTRT